jgi:serine protease Do
MRKPLIFIAVVVMLIAALKPASFPSRNSFKLPSLTWDNPTPAKSTTPPPKHIVLKGTEEERRIQVIDNALPSVVTIGVNITTREPSRIQIDPYDFFGFRGESGFRRIPGKERKIDENIGSGFVVSADGIIVTNKHVADLDDATYKVRFNDGTVLDVEKIYKDLNNDLALLKVNPKKPLIPLVLGDSDKLKLGQSAIAIGTPLGEFTNSVTTGIISGLGRGITAGSPFSNEEKLDGVIQTDAAISQGNSGGPLLNSSGEVIGVNTAVAGQGENIGFAIPTSVVKRMISEFEKRGSTFDRAYMGIRYQMIDKATARREELVEGAYVQEVIGGSPAQRAGIEPDDVITSVDGVKMSGTDESSVAKVIAGKKIGDSVVVTYWRNGEEKTVTLTLEKMK